MNDNDFDMFISRSFISSCSSLKLARQVYAAATKTLGLVEYLTDWFYFICLQANTDVLVGVKAEVKVPRDDAPTKGYLEFFVDW